MAQERSLLKNILLPKSAIPTPLKICGLVDPSRPVWQGPWYHLLQTEGNKKQQVAYIMALTLSDIQIRILTDNVFRGKTKGILKTLAL